MKRTRVIVPWKGGLHLRTAAALVVTAQSFRSSLVLRCAGRIANLRSILSVLALCAAMGSAIDVEASGDDEQDAMQAVEAVFSTADQETPVDESGLRP